MLRMLGSGFYDFVKHFTTYMEMMLFVFPLGDAVYHLLASETSLDPSHSRRLNNAELCVCPSQDNAPTRCRDNDKFEMNRAGEAPT